MGAKYLGLEIPIRLKLGMLDDLVQIMSYLHKGDKKAADLLIEDLKIRATFLESPIQEAVLNFSEQVQFQYTYDPWHKVNQDVVEAADRLIKAMGFRPPLKVSA